MRERESDRQTVRQTDRQTDRQRQRDRDRKTGTETDKQRERDRDRQTDKQTDKVALLSSECRMDNGAYLKTCTLRDQCQMRNRVSVKCEKRQKYEGKVKKNRYTKLRDVLQETQPSTVTAQAPSVSKAAATTTKSVPVTEDTQATSAIWKLVS